MTSMTLTLMAACLFPFAAWLAIDLVVKGISRLDDPHPRCPVTDDLDCEEYRAAADPDAVYDQVAADFLAVAAGENELAGGGS
jgi:hypothetical protein